MKKKELKKRIIWDVILDNEVIDTIQFNPTKPFSENPKFVRQHLIIEDGYPVEIQVVRKSCI
jgi:hypothetical protein